MIKKTGKKLKKVLKGKFTLEMVEIVYHGSYANVNLKIANPWIDGIGTFPKEGKITIEVDDFEDWMKIDHKRKGGK